EQPTSSCIPHEREPKRREKEQAIYANLPHSCVLGPVLHQNSTDAVRLHKPVFESSKRTAGKKKEQRAQEFHQVKPAQDLKVIAERGDEDRGLFFIIQLGSFNGGAV